MNRATPKNHAFSEEEMVVDDGLGYPKAYAKLCRSHNALQPYNQGPPSIFVPYTLQPQEALRAKDLNQMFPVLDPDAVPSVNPRGYVNILWKQLDHLGNAGFDPAMFRVDPFGNVLYLHADTASPLSWDIDHWFPCSRGGKTVPNNLRILQWQVCRKKQNKLDFLIPWWDFQLGISVNQFLSIFASKNSEFRNRAFSFMFPGGGSEELNALQTIESHRFPQHFIEMKQQLGLAPAALVPSQGNAHASVLRPLDINRSLKSCPGSSLSVGRKYSAEEDDGNNMAIQRIGLYTDSKENDKPDANPYLSIAIARDSLRHRDETKKKQTEMNQLDVELNELKQKNESERVALQHLEELLIKKRRRVEKCRRLAEAQSTYRALLEKMIRDAMHQSVLYKEQLRLNQAATSTLMARLEAQRAICDSSEQELNKRYKRRDEIEKQIRPGWEHARKRSRTDDTLLEERHDEQLLLSMSNPLRKELRKFLEEEQKASEVGSSTAEGREPEHVETSGTIEEAEGNLEPTNCKIAKKNSSTKSQHDEDGEAYSTAIVVRDVKSNQKWPHSIQRTHQGNEEHRTMARIPAMYDESCSEANGLEKNQFCTSPDRERTEDIAEDGKSLKEKLERVAISEERHYSKTKKSEKSFCFQSPHEEDDAEHRHQVGKGNVERWLKKLLENAKGEDGLSADSHKENRVSSRPRTLEEETSFNLKHDEGNIIRRDCIKNMCEKSIHTSGIGSISARKGSIGSRRSSMDGRGREERNGGVSIGESSRGFMSFPSSPSVILRKGVDCMGRKPKVMGDQEEEYKDNYKGDLGSKFIKAWPRVLNK
ncbi:hypothetical protein J5N97_003995 [Dioscorea zingiberensis]|uniref:Trichohyalin n=1 Tax=Dioscorea zingiberensis TaxID=325984 RepID=A0A9D5HQY5_9LILI|nr:hypothetical protein J5N97_003995 [Dioscorea zingiberensis]